MLPLDRRGRTPNRRSRARARARARPTPRRRGPRCRACRSAALVLLLCAVFPGASACSCTSSCGVTSIPGAADPTGNGGGGRLPWCYTTDGCGSHWQYGCLFGVCLQDFYWLSCTIPPASYTGTNGIQCYPSSACGSGGCPSNSLCMDEGLGNCINTPNPYNYQCINSYVGTNGNYCYYSTTCSSNCGAGTTCAYEGNSYCASTPIYFDYQCITVAAPAAHPPPPSVVPTPSATALPGINGASCYSSSTCSYSCPSGSTCTYEGGSYCINTPSPYNYQCIYASGAAPSGGSSPSPSTQNAQYQQAINAAQQAAQQQAAVDSAAPGVAARVAAPVIVSAVAISLSCVCRLWRRRRAAAAAAAAAAAPQPGVPSPLGVATPAASYPLAGVPVAAPYSTPLSVADVKVGLPAAAAAGGAQNNV